MSALLNNLGPLLVVIGILIGIGIASLIGAIFLRAGAKWVQKMDVPFGNAYVTALLIYIAQSVVGFVLGFAVGAVMQSQDAVLAAALLMAPVGFLISTGCVSSRLHIPFGRACLVSLIMLGLGLAIGVVFVGGIILILQFM